MGENLLDLLTRQFGGANPFTVQKRQLFLLRRARRRIYSRGEGFTKVARELVRRTRGKAGGITDIWLAGVNAKHEKAVATEIERRYAPRKRPAR